MPAQDLIPALLPAECDFRLKSTYGSKAPSKGGWLRRKTCSKTTFGMQQGCCFVADVPCVGNAAGPGIGGLGAVVASACSMPGELLLG